jgi:hypothetical protein
LVDGCTWCCVKRALAPVIQVNNGTQTGALLTELGMKGCMELELGLCSMFKNGINVFEVS